MPTYIDIHCHPSLKYDLFGTKITDDSAPPKDMTLLEALLSVPNLHTSLPRMKNGSVGAVWASHYVPERGLIDKATLDPGWKKLFLKVFKKPLSKFEKTPSPTAPTLQAIRLIKRFAKHVQSHNAVCPKSFHELTEAMQHKKPVFLHTLEGAHHLGRGRMKNGKPDVNGYLDALQIFQRLGVCSMTLGHFFENDCVTVVNGLPPEIIRLLGYPTSSTDHGLSDIGQEVVHWMFKNGMIVDLTHSSPKTRQKVFELNTQNKPIVFSHTGVAEVFKKYAPPAHYNDHRLNPSDEEIRKIKECQGVIGIIMYRYWLNGNEEVNNWLGIQPDAGLPFVIETIEHIHHITGSYDNIAIGTDFDGFTDVLDDVTDSSQMHNVAEALHTRFGPDAVKRIMKTNALRVLEQGWI